MINASRYLTASVQDGAVILSTTHPESTLRVIGSTVKNNSPQGEIWNSVSSVVLYPEPGEEGIIALYLTIYQGRDQKQRVSQSNLSIFLKVEQRDGQPRIDLERPWFPTKRIGSVVRDDVQVEVRGKIFTTSSLYRDRKPGDPFPQMDGDLLCRYLFGSAHACDVINAATAPLLEESARAQLGTAQNRIRTLTATIQSLSRNLERTAHDNEQTGAFARELYADYCVLRDAVLSAEWLHDLLKKLPQRFIPKRLTNFFTNFERVRSSPKRELPA